MNVQDLINVLSDISPDANIVEIDFDSEIDNCIVPYISDSGNVVLNGQEKEI